MSKKHLGWTKLTFALHPKICFSHNLSLISKRQLHPSYLGQEHQSCPWLLSFSHTSHSRHQQVPLALPTFIMCPKSNDAWPCPPIPAGSCLDYRNNLHLDFLLLLLLPSVNFYTAQSILVFLSSKLLTRTCTAPHDLPVAYFSNLMSHDSSPHPLHSSYTGLFVVPQISQVNHTSRVFTFAFPSACKALLP